MRLVTGAFIALLLVTGPIATQARAQRARSLVAGAYRGQTQALSDTVVKRPDSLEVRPSQSPAQRRMLRVLGGAGIGALLGATVGIVAADRRTTNGNYLDHSEDGLVYFFDALFGAAVGGVVGGVVGFFWK